MNGNGGAMHRNAHMDDPAFLLLGSSHPMSKPIGYTLGRMCVAFGPGTLSTSQSLFIHPVIHNMAMNSFVSFDGAAG